MADECELMRKIVRDALFKVAYHERELSRAHKLLAVTHALVKRTDIQMTDEEAERIYNEVENEEDCETAVDLLAFTLGSALNGVEYHETELRDAHNNLAQAKALAQRARIEVPIAEIAAEERERMAS